jgi:HK97 family phage prohead protease
VGARIRTSYLKSHDAQEIEKGQATTRRKGASAVIATSGLLEGYAARFDQLDSQGRIYLCDAFNETLRGYKQDGTAPALLWRHLEDEIVGRIVKLSVDDIGVLARVRLNLTVPRARECLTFAKAGDLGFSTGITTSFRKPGTVEQCKLREISLTTSPANPTCRATEVHESLSDAAALTLFLIECGISEQQAQLLAAGGLAALSSSNETPQQTEEQG